MQQTTTTTTTTKLVSLLALASTVAAHGRVTSPPARVIGAAFKAACGEQVYNNQASDPNGNIQAMAQVGASQSDYDAAACGLSLCKGYKFADSTANLQTYSAGETVAFTVDIVAPHTGTANVSVVNTKTNTVVGANLAYWSVYASTSTGVTANETSFSVKLPEDLTGCTTAGECALQWWWDARSIDQTYMSCVDFVMGAGGSGAAAPSAATTPAVATVTVAAVPSSTASQATTLQTVVATSSAAKASSTTTPCRRRKRTVTVLA